MRWFTFLLLPFCIAAESTNTLTWEDCVREARIGNADLLASKENVIKSQAAVRAAWAPFVPSLSGSASYSQGNTTSASGGVSAFGASTTTEQYSYGLSLSQNIFNGFQDRSKLLQARANLASSEASLRSQKATLSQTLKKAFSSLLYSQLAVSLSREIEKRRKDNTDLVNLRFDGGRENKGSLLKSKAQYHQAIFEVHQSLLNLEVAQQQLAVAMGRKEFKSIVAQGELKVKEAPTMVDPLTLAKFAPSVEKSAADLRAAQEGVDAASGALSPSLAFSASASKVGQVFPPDTSRWSFGLTLTVPIFRYSDWESISSAKAEERKAEHALQSADQQAAVALASSLAKYRLAGEKVDVQEENFRAAKVRAEIARSQYTSGLITYSEWDLIEADLITQEQNLLIARRDAVGAEADWEQALGKGDIE